VQSFLVQMSLCMPEIFSPLKREIKQCMTPLIYLQAICQWHQEVLLQLSRVNRKTWIELQRVLGCQLCDLDGVASTNRQQPIALSSLCFLPVGETALVLLPPCSSSGVHNGLGTWVYLKSLGMLCAEKSGKHF
jgi:hypothetical protein